MLLADQEAAGKIIGKEKLHFFPLPLITFNLDGVEASCQGTGTSLDLFSHFSSPFNYFMFLTKLTSSSYSQQQAMAAY